MGGDEKAKIVDFPKCSLEENWDEKKQKWTGPKPLFMAGIYSIWHHRGKHPDASSDESENQEVYSYSIITRESNKNFEELHHRVPAILSSPEEVRSWLDPDLEGAKALNVLKPLEKDRIHWYPVSGEVGNSRNKDPDLNKPIELNEKGAKVTKSSQLMTQWL